MERGSQQFSAGNAPAKPEDSQSYLTTMVKQPARWLDGSGQHADMVISSRIRLARNFRDIPFPNRASASKLGQALTRLYDCYAAIDELRDAYFFNMNALSRLERQFLMERHLISPQFVDAKKPAGLIVSRDETLSIMINEEDHLRMQCIRSGLGIENAWQLLHRLDDALSQQLDFAFSDQFGYLTACPTNTGTGIRVSVFINLPALALSKKIDDIIHDIAPSEIAIRGFYGEGSDVLGNFFQISNQLTLGRTEQSVINRIHSMAEQLVSHEANARQTLMQDEAIVVEDQIARAVAIIKHARLMDSVEAIHYLSLLRLGRALNLVSGIKLHELNELLVLTQPAHLQLLYNRTLEARERDILRIKVIRNRLNF
ncbi:MAG: protein arginine kinase [candidate division KSB1 bacterium]|nr:protein arginine kinase [candidate division KSB1 bacterium]MDZ7340621.1 protein arginine kinase [candidate division KSB1 bacterium]